MIGKATILVSALIVIGLLIWARRTKKYSQALCLLMALVSVDSCIIAVLFSADGRFWQGPLLIGLGLDVLLGIVFVINRRLFCADKPAA
jgi:hypothetical protein